DRLARFQTEVADAQQNSQADRKGRLQSVDRQELEAAKTRAEKARRDFNERQMAAVTLQREHDSVGRCLKDMDGEIATWQKRNEQALSRIADLEKRREQIDREHRQASQLPDRLEEIRVTLLEAMAAQETAARDLADAIALAETRFQDVTKNEQDVSRQLQQVREDMVRFEMRHESARSDLAAAIEAIRETKSGTPEALAELVKSIDRIPESLSAIDEEIARLRHRRESIGAVNLRAVQDMQDLETEKASIVREKEELEAAIRKIRGSVANLNREGRSRLHDAFENVRKNFHRLITSLVEGGTAELELIEGDDPLRSGLEIRCHPPGKRQTTLGLMSGGEQTLTSIALIFAFFLTNPAPVSVLDEIDAQLDDANVLRLCNLLDTMVRKTGTRFVIVTHNAVTMSRMSRLYGVTMQEKGVSQLVYVDLGEAERLAA
ncbi:MAG: chromosome segregation protein SMC, partial [Rhodobacteraceae bacterium]|nr:chromosome segregation protein SMC [Paracoccaceae bacterium]